MRYSFMAKYCALNPAPNNRENYEVNSLKANVIHVI